MTNLQVSKVLNTKDSFQLNGKRYTLIMVDPDDSTRYKCMCVDSVNGASIDSILIDIVPTTFQQFTYIITNPSSFVPGNVIFAYKKTVKEIKKLNGIINLCNSTCISFTFKDIGAEVRTQMLTARQIATDEITISVYDNPTIG